MSVKPPHSRKAKVGNRYDVLDGSGRLLGGYTKYRYGRSWVVRVEGVPWRPGTNGRVPYPGLADTKAEAEKIIIETAAQRAPRYRDE